MKNCSATAIINLFSIIHNAWIINNKISIALHQFDYPILFNLFMIIAMFHKLIKYFNIRNFHLSTHILEAHGKAQNKQISWFRKLRHKILVYVYWFRQSVSTRESFLPIWKSGRKTWKFSPDCSIRILYLKSNQSGDNKIGREYFPEI